MIYKQKFLKKQSPKMFGSSRNNNTSTSKLLSAKGCFFYSLLILGSFYIAPSHADQQEDIITACNEAARLLKDDNDISAALEEARWCVEGLEQMKTQIAQNVLPDEVEGFVGGEISSQSVMGMTMIERIYTNNGGEISVSLTSGGGAASGLAAIAQMGLSMGSQTGTKIRVQRRTVVDMSQGDEPTFMVQLKSGGILNITSEGADYDTTLNFVKSLPIAKIDEALED